MGPLSYDEAVGNITTSANAVPQLKGSVAQLAPYATSYHGAPQPVPYSDFAAAKANSGVVAGLEHFLGGVATGIGHIGVGVGSWLEHHTVQMVEAPFKFANSGYHTAVDAIASHSQGQQSAQLVAKQKNLTADWRSGKITTEQFKLGLAGLSKAQDDLNKQINDTVKRLQFDGGVMQQTALDTVATAVTLLTAGIGAPEITAGEKLASTWLIGREAEPVILKAAANLNKITMDSKLFSSLPESVQFGLQKATAEALVHAPITMSSGQLAKTAIVSVALKYPVYFGMIAPTAHQIYAELDNKKYGDAVRTIAFNALLFASGGPIGQAFKYGGKALSGLSARTFGQSSFWDEASKFVGNGNIKGFAVAAQKIANALPEAERADFYKNLAAAEATNLHAMEGDAVAAAARFAQGMQNMRGAVDLKDLSHEQVVNQMVTDYKDWKEMVDFAKAHGLPEPTQGRIDTFDKNSLADLVSKLDGTDTRMNWWQRMKQSNPNQAWANNVNFDKQMTNLISKHTSGVELRKAINNIDTQRQVEGFPKELLNKWAKNGHFPIEPTNVEAPFKEGDKVTSAFGQGAFWTKTVQPLPILGSAGALLTGMGLSPQASVQRVYQIFNENLAKNLDELGVTLKTTESKPATTELEKAMQQQHITPELLSKGKLSGPAEAATAEVATDAATSDLIIKQLSSYAKTLKLPVMDLRQLTVKNIRDALGVSRAEAANVQHAIGRSMLDVPMSIRGLGDHVVDMAYPALRRYLRVQGAARFSWNPFFQYLRLIPKTEFLSEVEGGGVFSSMFAGRLGQINKIRDGLRSAGAFEEPGRFGQVLSGEAVEAAGATRNLSKRLLPMQERSISGLIDAQANRMGMDWKTYIQAYPEQVKDTVQMIAEYDKRSSLLNSPMLRTLNIAFFPLRFETKVAQIMARNLSQTSLLTQVSVIKGLLSAHDWLNSPEGMAWYSQNADAIGLFKYITPLATMGQIFMSLTPGHDHHLGNFGELGGLPFGWIPQILDSEGKTHFNQPGVNAKTGEVFPQYVPATDKGHVAIAIQDFLGSLFSYPGAQIGAPTKASITRMAALGIVQGNKKTDLKLTTPTDLSPDQQRYQQLVQQLKAAPVKPVESSTVQPVGVKPLAQPKQTLPVNGKSGGSSKKAKKADFRPALLPGQTSLGQLP